MKDFVRDYIVQRTKDVDNNPTLKTKGRITLSDVFYDLRKPMEEAGWEPEGWNHPKQRRRQKIQVTYVKQVCDELEITRASIGIIAGESAHMYFRGRRYSVSIDDLNRLKRLGTDILIIEKEGIAEQLRDLAASYGIALIHGRGFLTEYASELSSLANDEGGNIAILTDFDDSGITIALQLPDVPRIGIDFDTLADLGISDKLEQLEEMYKPDNHLIHIKNEHPDIEDLEYLQEKRIEINAVRNYVGSKRFWEWIVSKLGELFPARDYNRAITIPTAAYFRPVDLNELINIIDNGIAGVLAPLIEECKEELRGYQGFIKNIDKYESSLSEDFQYEIDEHEDLGPIKKSIARLVKKYNSQSNR
jgi:hypothetical protein